MGRKMAYVKQCFLFADQDLPLPGRWTGGWRKMGTTPGQGIVRFPGTAGAPANALISQRLRGGERFEQALQDLENIRDSPHPMEYEDLNRRLTRAPHGEVMFHAKQTYWGCRSGSKPRMRRSLVPKRISSAWNSW